MIAGLQAGGFRASRAFIYHQLTSQPSPLHFPLHHASSFMKLLHSVIAVLVTLKLGTALLPAQQTPAPPLPLTPPPLAPAVPSQFQPAIPPSPPSAPVPGAPMARPTPFDNAVTLQASLVLQPALLSGPFHRVREDVVTQNGINTYAVDSNLYGTLIARGNTQLLVRITEMTAMRRLDEMTQTEGYHKALERVAEEEEDAYDDYVPDDRDRLESKPSSGIGKFFHRIGESERAEERSEMRSYQKKSTEGTAKAKRDLCRMLGVNPYTTNAALLRKLDDMSRALAVGGFRMVPGPASADNSLAAVLLRTVVPTEVSTMIFDRTPADMRVLLQTNLQMMGMSPGDAAAFLANQAFTPALHAQFILGLQALPGVAGREILVRDANALSTEDMDAIFYAETAQLLATLARQGWQIASIQLHNKVPYCAMRDGSVLLALHWDYARWSPMAARAEKWLSSLQVDGKKPTNITIAMTGLASPAFRQEMEKRGYRVLDRLMKGPLK
jgi:hypothetical protein